MEQGTAFTANTHMAAGTFIFTETLPETGFISTVLVIVAKTVVGQVCKIITEGQNTNQISSSLRLNFFPKEKNGQKRKAKTKDTHRVTLNTHSEEFKLQKNANLWLGLVCFKKRKAQTVSVEHYT